MSKLSSFTFMLLFVALVASACSDNSIDTRTEPSDVSASLKFPVELTDDRIEAGGGIYATKCASCHGPVDGRAVLNGAPEHGDGGHTWHHPDRLLHQWILDKPPLATLMPAFRGTLSDEEVMQVIAYIKTHWMPEILERQTEGSVQYEAQIVEFGTE